MGRRGKRGLDRACPVLFPGTNLQHRRICATRQPTLYVSHCHPAVSGVISSPLLLLTPTCVHHFIDIPACHGQTSYLIDLTLEYDRPSRTLVKGLGLPMPGQGHKKLRFRIPFI